MTNCIICSNSQIVDYTKAGTDYPLKKCTNCGLVFDENFHKPNEKLYSKDYFISQEIKGGYFNYFEESIVNKLTFKYRLGKIYQKIKSKKVQLLDFGCALGDFLEVGRVLNWKNIFGVDVSKFAVQECLNKGLSVYKIGDRSDAQKILKKDFFDVITLQDVVEHFKNPTEELSIIYKFLKPGGLLLITTPDISSLSNKIMGKNWYHYKKSEHLFYFDKGNIKKLLSRVGFINIEIKPTLSWVTIKYLINRLSYYFPREYFRFFTILSSNPLFHIAFPIFTGEMEIWTQKPTDK